MGKSRVQPPKTGHVVEVYHYGNSTVKICDDYCRDKTPEDVQKILDACGRIWWQSCMLDAARAEQAEREKAIAEKQE